MIMVTVLVCKIMKEMYQEKKKVWEMVAEKGMVWVKKETKKLVGENVNIDWDVVGKRMLDAIFEKK